MENFQLESQNHQIHTCVNLLKGMIAGLALSACTNVPPQAENQINVPNLEIKTDSPQVEIPPEPKPTPLIIIPSTKQPTPKEPIKKPSTKGIPTGKVGPLGDKICIYPDNTTRLCKPKPDVILQKYRRDIPGEEITIKGKTEIIPPTSEYCTVYEPHDPKNGKKLPIKARCIPINPKKSK